MVLGPVNRGAVDRPAGVTALFVLGHARVSSPSPVSTA
jgi:hypothetical protein